MNAEDWADPGRSRRGLPGPSIEAAEAARARKRQRRAPGVSSAVRADRWEAWCRGTAADWYFYGSYNVSREAFDRDHR